MFSAFSLFTLLGVTGAVPPFYYFNFTVADKFLPPLEAIVIVERGKPGPNASKYEAIAKANGYKPLQIGQSAGPYDVWWVPKTGLGVCAVPNFKFRGSDSPIETIQLDKHLGLVNLRGDNQPRAALITIAPQDDPGPGEKGHVAVQTAKDYRVDIIVPEGFYSLWITPENGGRPRKINDRLKAQAGKTVQLD